MKSDVLAGLPEISAAALQNGEAGGTCIRRRLREQGMFSEPFGNGKLRIEGRRGALSGFCFEAA